MSLKTCTYTPFVGTGSFPTTPPTVVRRSTILFTYPYVTPTWSLELRMPNFDTTEQFENRKINRRSRGGTLQIFRDAIWPVAERLILAFDHLSQENVTDLFEFIKISLGKEIGYLDFESRQRKGIIITPSMQVNEPVRSPCNFSVSLEFEGTLV
jgi:hypothetical protein